MINRRNVIMGAGASAVAVMAPISEPAEAQVTDTTGVSGLVPDNEEAERVLYELASFDARYYSEEGVPMVLACENLADPASNSIVPNATNSRFAKAFDHYAELLDELRSGNSKNDVGPVVELIAHRDFASGGGDLE